MSKKEKANYNTGDCNTGYYNTGHHNTGDCNTGCRNTGHYNTSYRNTGNANIGDFNTGHANTGNYNTGNCNTGHYNTGSRNTGSHNTGSFNAKEATYRFFDKDTGIPWSEFPHHKVTLQPQLTEWISSESMSNEEKKANPTHVTTGGYLKTYEFKEACKRSWESLSNEQKDIFLSLDFDIQYASEITGIDFMSYVFEKEILHKEKK